MRPDALIEDVDAVSPRVPPSNEKAARPASGEVCAGRREQDKRPDAGGGVTAAVSPVVAAPLLTGTPHARPRIGVCAWLHERDKRHGSVEGGRHGFTLKAAEPPYGLTPTS